MRKILGVGLVAVLLSACGGYDVVMPPVGVVAHEGALGVGVGSAANLTRGSSVQVTVTLARPSGFTGTVDLSAETLPTGITASFVPETVPANSTTSTLTLSASNTATLGITYPTVRARGAGVTDATVQIVMNVSQ